MPSASSRAASTRPSTRSPTVAIRTNLAGGRGSNMTPLCPMEVGTWYANGYPCSGEKGLPVIGSG